MTTAGTTSSAGVAAAPAVVVATIHDNINNNHNDNIDDTTTSNGGSNTIDLRLKYGAISATDSYQRSQSLFAYSTTIQNMIDHDSNNNHIGDESVLHDVSINRRKKLRYGYDISDVNTSQVPLDSTTMNTITDPTSLHQHQQLIPDDNLPEQKQPPTSMPSIYANPTPASTGNSTVLTIKQSSSATTASSVPQPKWHAPWTLATVLSSHLGWVRCIAIDTMTNRLFATGSTDHTIKIWNLPNAVAGNESNSLQYTLTGHISSVRGLVFSDRHPYLFSAGEDKTIKCWDLETNQVVRHYHGHLSGIYCLAMHPTLDVLVSAGRDAVARVWDIRTKTQIHVLSGHDHTIGSLLTSSVHPQVITGSHDCTIKLWDLVAGKCFTTLTHHQKSIRAMVAAPPALQERTFVSVAADSIRKWQTKNGRFLHKYATNQNNHNMNPINKKGIVLNAAAVQDDGVLVTGGDDGSMKFYDYHTGYNFQSEMAKVQPGSIEYAENAIMALSFDMTGTRLITGEADKSIKIWKQNDDTTVSEVSHPIDMKSWRKSYLAQSKERF